MSTAHALRQLGTGAAGFWRRSDGVSTLEFGLVAPTLFLSLLAMADLGFAFSERMTMDHVLRAGAQKAIGAGSEAEILEVLRTTAARNFVLAGAAPAEVEDALFVDVTRYSACPGNADTVVDISTICAGPQPTSIFYRLTALKHYHGMLLPEMELERLLLVQIR